MIDWCDEKGLCAGKVGLEVIGWYGPGWATWCISGDGKFGRGLCCAFWYGW